jgi:hypothetical protein
MKYVDVVMGVLRARDVAATRGAAGGGDSVIEADRMESLRVMAFRVLEAPKPRMSMGCFVLAAGFEHEGVRSERQWADRQNISPTHVSNEVMEWQRVMRLPKTSNQKSAAALESYRGSNGANKRKIEP